MGATHVATGLRLLTLGTLVLGVLTAHVDASLKTNIDGVTVAYTGTGNAIAYFDSQDGTLTVGIDGGLGSLSIAVTPSAVFGWGNYVDIYIAADNATLKSIKIKGNSACTPFVAGQVWYVGKFTISDGAVGDTTYYGQDFGLGMASNLIPAKVTLTNSFATAQVLGFPYPVPGSASATDSASAPMAYVGCGRSTVWKLGTPGRCSASKAARALQCAENSERRIGR